MNTVLEEIISTGHVQTPDRAERIEVHSSVSPDKGRFLQGIVTELNADVTLETGCCFGVSGLWICDGLEATGGSRHIVIDPNQHDHWKSIGCNNFKDAGYEHLVEFFNLPAHLALPKLEERNQRIDFAYIDGWHTFDYALADFFFIDRLLRVGGVVALDDTNLPAVQKVCRYILTNRSYGVYRCFVDRGEPWFTRTERLLYHAGRRHQRVRRLLRPETAVPNVDLGMLAGSTCIAIRKESNDDRAWDFHRDF